MIGRGSGASLFSVGQRVRLVEHGGRSFGATVTEATFFGISLKTRVPVRGRRDHFVPNNELAKRVSVLRLEGALEVAS